MSTFSKATKQGVRIRLAIEGAAGSGKTYSALAIGTRLPGKVALVDTENGSAAHYADLFDFDSVNMAPPYSPERFVEVIRMAADEGYQTLVIDSLSHEWSGEGGILSSVDAAGGRFDAWKKQTPRHRKLIDAIVHSPINIIATMRTKVAYVIEEQENKRGRKVQAPRKVGTKPEQREGMDYEFDIVMSMDAGAARITKTRCPALDGYNAHHPGDDLARVLNAWMAAAPAIEQAAEQATEPEQGAKRAAPMSVERFAKECDAMGLHPGVVKAWRTARKGDKDKGWDGDAGGSRMAGTIAKLAKPVEQLDLAAWFVEAYPQPKSIDAAFAMVDGLTMGEAKRVRDEMGGDTEGAWGVMGGVIERLQKGGE